MAKTLKVQLAEAKEKIQELENKLQVAEQKITGMTLHDWLDGSIKHLQANQFYIRNIKSSEITSLVRSARERLRLATKK